MLGFEKPKIIILYIFNVEKRELLVVKTNFCQLVSAIGRFQGNLI